MSLCLSFTTPICISFPSKSILFSGRSVNSLRQNDPGVPKHFKGHLPRRSKKIATVTSTSTPTTTSTSSITEISSLSDWSPETHPLHLYNTLTRQKEKFTTHTPNEAKFYSCGPTVYDYAHIGNFRAFLTYDVVKRWLMYRGIEVIHAMNLTDVDDKIIIKSIKTKTPAKEITEKYKKHFFSDLSLLNVIPASYYPCATENINEIEAMISKLKEKGHAYQSNIDQSTYFRVSSFSNYGKLGQLDKRLQQQQQQSNNDEMKENEKDFALWKSYKDEDGDVYWDSKPLGKGRPGWHIECSCMAMKYLGEKLDIHGGGIDLVFPHHDNEIAQSEAVTGEQFSTFWIHNGFVNIDNEKMSKSLGNFLTLRNVIKSSIDARAFRYLVVSSQYRSALSFTDECIKSSKNTIKRLDSTMKKLNQLSNDDDSDTLIEIEEVTNVISKVHEDFCNAMDDDLNSPRACAAMFGLVNSSEKWIKRNQINRTHANLIIHALNDMDRVFGIFYQPNLEDEVKSEGNEKETEIPPHLQVLLDERAKVRKAKNFSRADEIRDEITAAGFSIIDTKEGAKLKPL